VEGLKIKDRVFSTTIQRTAFKRDFDRGGSTTKVCWKKRVSIDDGGEKGIDSMKNRTPKGRLEVICQASGRVENEEEYC